MKYRNLIAVCVCGLSILCQSSNAQYLKQNEAFCNYNSNGRCEVSYKTSNSGKAYHRIQQLDSIDGTWAIIGDHGNPLKLGDTVDAGGLYRVVGCDDTDANQGCRPTKVFWAPVIVELKDIPSRVRMSDGAGGFTWGQVSRNEPLIDQLRQLNVYLMTDVVVQARGGAFDEMTPHKAHKFDASIQYDAEHLIHSDVYHQYSELIKVLRERR